MQILFVEDRKEDADLALLELKKQGLEITSRRVVTKEELIQSLQDSLPCLVLCDYCLPTLNGMEALTLIREVNPSIPVIMFTGSQNETVAVECMKAGAADYILKENITRLPFAVKDAIERERNRTFAEIALKELLKSEHKFRELYENAPIPHQSLNEDGTFKDINKAWLNTLGYTREEIIGSYFGDFLHPDWKAHFEINFPAFKKRGTVHGVEFRIRHKEGHYLDISFDGCIGYHPDGSFKQTYCVFQDITKRKEAEESLKSSARKYRELFESMAQGVFYQDASGQLTDVNQSALTMMGLTRDQFLGRTSYSPEWQVISEQGHLLTPEEHPAMVALQTGLPVKDRLLGVYIPAKKTYNWMIVNAIPEFREGDENPFRVATTLHDVTMLRETQRLLKESIDRFIQVSESAGEWFWEVDANGLYTYSNSVVQEILGYSVDEIVGRKHFFDFFDPDERDVLKAAAMDLFARKGSFKHFVNKKISRDGQTVILETTCFPILDNEGKLLGYRGMDMDMTERNQAEESLKRAKQIQDAHLANSPLAIIEFDPSFRVTRWSVESEKIFGWTEEEILGKAIGDIPWVYREDIGKVEEITDGMVHGTAPQNISVNRNLRKDGSVIWCEWHNSALYDDHGKMTSIFSLVLDITVQWSAETALRQKIEELERFNDLTVDREFDMIKLKLEINELLKRLGENEKYKIVD